MALEEDFIVITNDLKKLTEDERSKLSKDVDLVSEFKQLKLEREAQKNWDLFYKRNSTKFFKDRHWTTREFLELCENAHNTSENKILLEVGCGVGNFIFPLLKENPNLFIYACDFSPRAINYVKENPLYDAQRCCAFQCDVTKQSLKDSIGKECVDLVSLIFVLSSLHPDTLKAALKNIYDVLKPGGMVLLRDYGIYDAAMLKFKKGSKLKENFYVRQDGTRAHYFTTEMISTLFTESGFEIIRNDYVQRCTVNLKENVSLGRVFIQGKFRRKLGT